MATKNPPKIPIKYLIFPRTSQEPSQCHFLALYTSVISPRGLSSGEGLRCVFSHLYLQAAIVKVLKNL